jgi:hypothetical protein
VLVVSFGTEGNTYEGYAHRLRESCVQCGVAHDVEIIPPTPIPDVYLLKARFIMRMLEKHQQPVLYLDVDAIVAKSFSLPGSNWDIGLVPNDVPGRNASPTAACIVGANNTSGARALLETWAYVCDWRQSQQNDHPRLTAARILSRRRYTEIDLTAHLRGAVIRDYGRRKQYTVSGPIGLLAHKTVGQAIMKIKRRLGLPPLT